MVRLEQILSDTITGEWGQECTGGFGVKVLRTTNFTNEGILDFSNVVVREISANKVEKKKLLPCDIILEKSGGSDNQPVGRVVYFNKIDDVFLCNNFTQILRVNSQVAVPKYVFYHLFNLHKIGVTELLQNQTTGIRNLQIKNYMTLQIPLPPLHIQNKIAEVLNHINHLIEKRKEQIKKLDLLVKTLFVALFGDPVTNPMMWEVKRIDEIAMSRLGKMLDAKQQTGKEEYPYLANFNVQWFRFNLDTLNMMDFNEADRQEFALNYGDLLICEGGEVGRTAIWKEELSDCFFQKAVHRVRCNLDLCIPEYLAWVMYFKATMTQFDGIVTGVTIAHLTGEKLKTLKIQLPPLPLQTRFASIVQQVDKTKFVMQEGLKKLELAHKALMQQYFG